MSFAILYPLSSTLSAAKAPPSIFDYRPEDPFDFFRWWLGTIVTIYASVITLQSLWGWYAWLAGSPKYLLWASLGLLAIAVLFNIVGLDIGKWLQNAGGVSTYVPLVMLVGIGTYLAMHRGSGGGCPAALHDHRIGRGCPGRDPRRRPPDRGASRASRVPGATHRGQR